MATKSHMVKVRGLSVNCTETQLTEYFGNCNVKAVILTVNVDGRPSGEAFLEMNTFKDVKEAMKLNKATMGTRYLEVFEARQSDLTKSLNVGEIIKCPAWTGRGSKPNNVQSKPVTTSDQVEDCYFYQVKTCGRNNCPFLHRIFPEEVCKLFLFKKCKLSMKCSKQHLSPSTLPPPPGEEAARVSSVRQGRENIPGYRYRVREAVFECLDCEVATTSGFLLETHVRTEEHSDRVKQVMGEGKKVKGVVGDRGNTTWTSKDEDDWVAVRKKRIIKIDAQVKCEDIHVCNIPMDMTRETFKEICLQYGEVTKLTMLPMFGERAQHAHVSYDTEEAREFAAAKLKKLQNCQFAGASHMLICTSVDVERGQRNIVAEEFEMQERKDLQQKKQSVLSKQVVQQVASAREELESKLMLCQTRIKICKLNGDGPEKTGKLLQDQFEIHREMRNLEDENSRSISGSSLMQLTRSSSSNDPALLLPFSDEVFNLDAEESLGEYLSELKNLKLTEMEEEEHEKKGDVGKMFVSLSLRNQNATVDKLIDSKTAASVVQSTKAAIRRKKS